MTLAEYKIKRGFTIQGLADHLDTPMRTVVYWLQKDHGYRKRNGNHEIYHTRIVKTIPIKKGK